MWLVPALRFPEFTEEWKNTTLKNECSINPTSDKLKDEFVYVDLESVEKGELTKKQVIEKENAPSRAQRVLRNGDVLFQCVRPYQRNNYLVKNVSSEVQWVASTGYAQLRTERNNPAFIYHLLNTSSFNKKVIVRCTGSSYPAINSDDLSKIHFYICGDIEEQKRIADFLTLLDERIATQNKIIEDLKKLKSAIAETLFCTPKESMPAKRLSPYSKEWKLVKLSDICQRIQTKNIGRQCRQVLTIAAQYGLVNQEDFFNKTVASENLEGYYLLQKGDFAYNKSYSGDYTWGAIKRLERYDKGVLSPLYICFRPDSSKVDADFLAHYFESKKWYKGVADIAGEGARNHGLLNISVIDFFNTTHRIPNINEQKRIAKILNSLSLKSSCEQRIMQSLVMQRNYLLRNMFI